MILTQPFPAYNFSYKTLRFTFYAGAVVFLILILFRPFGFDKPPDVNPYMNAALYGLATFVVASLNALLIPKLFPVLFKEESWTIGREMLMMLWQVISIAAGNVVLTHYLYGNPVSVDNILVFTGITASVGIFPITLILLLKQQMLLRKYALAAKALDSQITTDRPPQHAATTTIHFRGDNQREAISVQAKDVLFISSADNYIRIQVLKNDVAAVHVLRSTLKKAEAAVSDNPVFFRCHRTYIVNLSHVRHVSGNAQGFKLHLSHTDEVIPVSRTLNEELGKQLKEFGENMR